VGCDDRLLPRFAKVAKKFHVFATGWLELYHVVYEYSLHVIYIFETNLL